MDKILKMREKHKIPDVSELTEKIIENLSIQKKEDEKRKQRIEGLKYKFHYCFTKPTFIFISKQFFLRLITEQETELRTVTSKLSTLVNDLANSDTVLEKKIDELQKHKEEIVSRKYFPYF